MLILCVCVCTECVCGGGGGGGCSAPGNHDLVGGWRVGGAQHMFLSINRKNYL